MSAYALPSFFPASSFEHENETASSESFNDESTHSQSLPQQSTHLDQPCCGVDSCSRPCYGDLDVVVNSANIDPRSLIFTNKKQKKSHYQHEENVTFELRVTFNGRRYTASRPFHRLRKLHAELVKECEILGMVMPELPKSDCDGNPSEKSHVMFPIARSGFSMIQSMMSSYAPVMEGWFSQVCLAVPTSPSLTNFLWEPLNNENETDDGRLSSIIEEDDYE